MHRFLLDVFGNADAGAYISDRSTNLNQLGVMFFFGRKFFPLFTDGIFSIADLLWQTAQLHFDLSERDFRSNQIGTGDIKPFAAVSLPGFRGGFGRLQLILGRFDQRQAGVHLGFSGLHACGSCVGSFASNRVGFGETIDAGSLFYDGFEVFIRHARQIRHRLLTGIDRCHKYFF